MRVALPVWNGRVSPVFDTARHLLIADIEGRELKSRSEIALVEIVWPARVRRLVNSGVEVLICGAISRGFSTMITASGIRVIPGIVGDVDEVLRAFTLGQIPSPQFFMPGWGGGRRRRFRGGRR